VAKVLLVNEGKFQRMEIVGPRSSAWSANAAAPLHEAICGSQWTGGLLYKNLLLQELIASGGPVEKNI
jgi:hypothetical protein